MHLTKSIFKSITHSQKQMKYALENLLPNSFHPQLFFDNCILWFRLKEFQLREVLLYLQRLQISIGSDQIEMPKTNKNSVCLYLTIFNILFISFPSSLLCKESTKLVKNIRIYGNQIVKVLCRTITLRPLATEDDILLYLLT